MYILTDIFKIIFQYIQHILVTATAVGWVLNNLFAIAWSVIHSASLLNQLFILKVKTIRIYFSM